MFFNEEFLSMYEELTKINSMPLVESSVGQIDLAKCRMIDSDVIDIRGEVESSACIDYKGKLTRIQVRTVIIRETKNGKEFLARKFRFRMALPGGGYDHNKDSGNILNTAKREAYEEFNLNLTNLVDTGIRTWKYREDPWVTQHIKNPNDRWTGYYSYYVIGKVAGTGDNENPEEVDKWKWYPIEQLEKVNKDVYNYVIGLNEAWGDGSHGEQDLSIQGKLSYCCENPVNLLKILESGLIKASSTPETHETDKIYTNKRGRPTFIKYPYVSFSKQLYSHAYRRPNKWSFGIVVDENALRSKGYELVDRNHCYKSLKFVALFTKGTDYYMAQTDLFGHVEITKEIFDLVYAAMINKSNKKLLNAKEDELIPGLTDITRKDAWTVTKSKTNSHKYGTANAQLKNIDFETKISLPGGSKYPSQFSISLQDIDSVNPGGSKLIMDYLLNNTYYNEGELRFWCKNNEPGVKFDPTDLHGVILPKVIVPEQKDNAAATDDLNEKIILLPHHEEAVHKILEYVDRHNLNLFTHNAADEGHFKNLEIDRGIKTRNKR